MSRMRSDFPHGLSSGKPALSVCPLDQLAPALARTGPAFALGWLETLRDFLRLREVFGCGAPEDEACGNFPDRERNPQFRAHAEEAVFHGGRARPLRQRDAGGSIPEGFDFFLEGIVELRVHPGAAAHGAGFC